MDPGSLITTVLIPTVLALAGVVGYLYKSKERLQREFDKLQKEFREFVIELFQQHKAPEAGSDTGTRAHDAPPTD